VSARDRRALLRAPCSPPPRALRRPAQVLLPHGAATAARMNAELRGSPESTAWDVGLLLGWVLQDDETPARAPFRWGWGTICDTWGGVDVHGLIGAVTDRGGYAFGMETDAALAGMLPVARYNASYARALGKWAANAVNAARLFSLPSTPRPSRLTGSGRPPQA